MIASPFSAHNPKLQTAWDATSLSALMQCPRYYQYTIIDGWRGTNEHFEFGGYFASAVERFKKLLLQGISKHDATISTLRWVIEATWDRATGPWSGRYADTWRCKGSEPYRNAKGNRAKCPYARVGNFTEGIGPKSCGVCGSPTAQERRWLSDYQGKDRYNLVRLAAAYCDDAATSPRDGPFPYAFPNGQPAVELSVQIPLPYKTVHGEPYLLTGHLDSIMVFGDEKFIADNKTTARSLDTKYFAAYSPNTQVDTYDLIGSVLWPDLHLSGVLIEGAQVLRSGEIRLAIGPQHRSEEQREEFLREIDYWLGQAEKFATDSYWPMNRRSCWQCDFKSICSKSPSKRELFLRSNFTVRKWNPLEER
jgi:hypothetical protein